MAEAGYADVTVAGIVQGARVSRSVFYAHFADKEDCFLDATGAGARVMSGRMEAAVRAVPADAPDEQVLRAAFLAFLGFLAEQPAYARVLYVDMPAAGPAAAERLDEATHRFAELNRKWHERARTRHPEWPSVPDQAYRRWLAPASNWFGPSSAWARPPPCQALKSRSCPCTWRSSPTAPGRRNTRPSHHRAARSRRGVTLNNRSTALRSAAS